MYPCQWKCGNVRMLFEDAVNPSWELCFSILKKISVMLRGQCDADISDGEYLT